MPDFYNKMKDKLRTVEQGADTIVWLAIAESPVTDEKNKGGQFFQVRFLTMPVTKVSKLFWPSYPWEPVLFGALCLTRIDYI
jgi:dehydrogenase/reductase SDR family protein 12